VRDRSNVFDQLHIQASRLERRDRTFTTRPRSFDSNLNITHSKLGCFLSSLLSRTLSGKRCALSATFESAGSCTRPAKSITFGIRDRHGGVVKCCVNMCNAATDVTANSFFLIGLCHCKVSYLIRSSLKSRKASSEFLSEILHAFFARNRLARTFTGPRVSLRSLTANRETSAVTHASVALDFP